MKDEDKIGHYCGVAGILSKEPINIPNKLFYLLFALQHRGQESAGIAYLKEKHIHCYKDLGLVSEVLSRYLQKEVSSHVGIGHVRYSTDGGNKVENSQPLHVTCNKGEIAIAHNGSITNAAAIRKELSQIGAIFQTTSDTELVLHLLSRSKATKIREATKEVLEKIEGAYSAVLMYGKNLVGIRDRHGYHPLYLGWKEDLTVIASETCALDSLGIKDFRQIEPGEIVLVNEKGVYSSFFAKGARKQFCIFEHVYFARPDSEIFGESVYQVRQKMGAALARQDKDLHPDMVISVPESGNIAAFGYAKEAGIPFEMGLTRNFYAGRSFIMPTTEKRQHAVRLKLNANSAVLKGKRIVVVDDSLVRGTTSKIIIKILKEAGAKEIHFRLSSPELHFPCRYGTDIPTYEELISNSFTPEKIAKMIGANSVKFLPLEEMKKCVQFTKDYCYACFDGSHEYPEKKEGKKK